MRGKQFHFPLGKVFSLSTFILVVAVPAVAQVTPITVMAGADYFRTVPGKTYVKDIPGIGLLNLIGNPIGPGNTDTIVQRQADADITNGSGTIPIELVALSLKSAAPVNVGGSFFDVFVTLHPDSAHNTGTMTITGDATGGAFTSSFDVFFDAKLVEVGNPSNTQTLTGLGLGSPLGAEGDWNPHPTPGNLLVSGPYPDPTDPNFPINSFNDHTSNIPPGEVDFWPGEKLGAQPPDCLSILNERAQLAAHGVVPAGDAPICPEPSALVLGMSGLVSLGLFRRARAQKEKSARSSQR